MQFNSHREFQDIFRVCLCIHIIYTSCQYVLNTMFVAYGKLDMQVDDMHGQE